MTRFDIGTLDFSMSADKLDTLERERLEADRQYNDALTAFDRALLHRGADLAAAPSADTMPPAPPGGWRARGVRAVRDWLLPWFDRQHAFNAQTTAAIDALIARDRERAAAFETFQSALIVFLQRLNAFVDTKDRQLAAAATVRLDEHDRSIAVLRNDALPEVRTQIAVLERAAAALKRRTADPASGS